MSRQSKAAVNALVGFSMIVKLGHTYLIFPMLGVYKGLILVRGGKCIVISGKSKVAVNALVGFSMIRKVRPYSLEVEDGLFLCAIVFVK